MAVSVGSARVLRTTVLTTAMSLLAAGAALAQPNPSATSTNADDMAAPNVINQTDAAPVSGVAIGPNPDPYEKFNRRSFAFSQYLYHHFIRPAAVFYSHATPRIARQGLHNAIQNVGEPVIFFNDVLQLHPKAAAQTLGRFAMNSTVGVAGLADPATASGLAYHSNGFGTTLGRYGVPAGPYLYIPVLGPSDIRDGVGQGVDAASDPLTWINYTGRWAVSAAKTVVGGLDTAARAGPQLQQIESMATDPYATIRSLYLQNRQAEITGGQVNINDLPNFGPEPGGANQAGEPGQPAPALSPAGAAAALPDRAAPTTAQPSGPPQ